MIAFCRPTGIHFQYLHFCVSIIAQFSKKCDYCARFICTPFSHQTQNHREIRFNRGGHHLWKSDCCCLLNHVIQLTWTDFFLLKLWFNLWKTSFFGKTIKFWEKFSLHANRVTWIKRQQHQIFTNGDYQSLLPC